MRSRLQLRTSVRHVQAREPGKGQGGGEMVGRRSWPVEPAHSIRRSGFPPQQRAVEHLPFRKKGELDGGKILRERHWSTSAVFLYLQRNFRWGNRVRPTLRWAPNMGARANRQSPEGPLLYSPGRRLAGRVEGRRGRPAPSRAFRRAVSLPKTAPSPAERRNPLPVPPPGFFSLEPCRTALETTRVFRSD